MTELTISYAQTAHGWKATVTRGDTRLYVTPNYERKEGAALAARAFLDDLAELREQRQRLLSIEASQAECERIDNLFRSYHE